jgi:hypothetical protein
MTNTTLKQLLSLHNKVNKVKGVWQMNRGELLGAIAANGYTIVETPTHVELRPLGGRTHTRKRVLTVKKN